MSKRFLIPALIALVVVVAVFAGCGSASGEHKVKRFIDERTSTAEAVEVLHEAQAHAAEKKGE